MSETPPVQSAAKTLNATPERPTSLDLSVRQRAASADDGMGGAWSEGRKQQAELEELKREAKARKMAVVLTKIAEEEAAKAKACGAKAADGATDEKERCGVCHLCKDADQQVKPMEEEEEEAEPPAVVEKGEEEEEPMESSSSEECLPDLVSETEEEREERGRALLRNDWLKKENLDSLDDLRSWEERFRMQQKSEYILKTLGLDLDSMIVQNYPDPATRPPETYFPSAGIYLKAHFPDVFERVKTVVKEEVSYLKTGDFNAYKQARAERKRMEGDNWLRRDAMEIRTRLIRKLCADSESELNTAEERRKRALDWSRAWCSMPHSFNTIISLAHPEADHHVLRLDGRACGHVHDVRVFHVILPQIFGAIETEWLHAKKPFGEGFFAYLSVLFEYLIHDLDLIVNHSQGKMCHNGSAVECVRGLFHLWEKQRLDKYAKRREGGGEYLTEVPPLALAATKGLERKWREKYFLIKEQEEKHRNIAELVVGPRRL